MFRRTTAPTAKPSTDQIVGPTVDAPIRSGATIEGGVVQWRFLSATAEEIDVIVHSGRTGGTPLRLTMQRDESRKDLWTTSFPLDRLDEPVLYHLRIGGENGHPEILRHDPDARGVVVPEEAASDGQLLWDAPFSVALPIAERAHAPQMSEPHVRRIMEGHVAALTARMPGLPPDVKPGTFEAARTIAAEIKELGYDTVQWMPIFLTHTDEVHVKKGLVNAWGYGSNAWKAPDPRFFNSTDPREQIQEMDRCTETFHEHGLKVVLDIVLNHTNGPSYHGLDNVHRLSNGYHTNHSGCGNTIDVTNERARERIRDTLHYWHHERKVDGFRFDLATILAMNPEGGLDTNYTFFKELQEELPTAIIILEPWGGFDPSLDGRHSVVRSGFSAYDANFRDGVRDYIQGVSRVETLKYLITGSDNVFMYSHGSDWPRKRLVATVTHDA